MQNFKTVCLCLVILVVLACDDKNEIVETFRPSLVESIDRSVVPGGTLDTLKTNHLFFYDSKSRVEKMVANDDFAVRTIYDLKYNEDGTLAQIDVREEADEILGAQRSVFVYNSGRLMEEKSFIIDGDLVDYYSSRFYSYHDCCPELVKEIKTVYVGSEQPYAISEFAYTNGGDGPSSIKNTHVDSGTFVEFFFNYHENVANAMLPYHICTQIQGNFSHLMKNEISSYSIRLTTGDMAEYAFDHQYSDEFFDESGKGKVNRVSAHSQNSQVFFYINYKFL